MISFENIVVYGFEAAIRGMRNPMNSWDRSDSWFYDFTDGVNGEKYDINHNVEPCTENEIGQMLDYIIGQADLDLMRRLYKAGSEHRKFMRMINITMDITAPLYWWKEFDTYKVGTVVNSCSTMHKIAERPFSIEDFSTEHLFKVLDGEDDDFVDSCCLWVDDVFEMSASARDEICMRMNVAPCAFPMDIMESIVTLLNTCRDLYLETNNKCFWWQMIQLLPSSYNQKRTVQFSYETAAKIIEQRSNHKLDEWQGMSKLLDGVMPYLHTIMN